MPDAATGRSEPHAPGGRSGGRRGVARDAGLRVGEVPGLPRRRELALALADHRLPHPSRHGCASRGRRSEAAAERARGDLVEPGAAADALTAVLLLCCSTWTGSQRLSTASGTCRG